MTDGHIAVLTNPEAGKGRGAHISEMALARLRDRDHDVRCHAAGSAAETRQAAQEAVAARPRALVVVGGDGTLTGVVEALTGTDVPLALIPAGTGNDFARALGIPHHDPAAAADLVVDGVPCRVDVGEVRSAGEAHPFLTVAALGFDARVNERTNRLRWPKGALRYYLALVIELARLRPVAFRLAVDDEEMTDAPGILIAVGNTDSYGGGMPICRGAASDDGLLDVVHVQPLGRLGLLRLFPRLLRGTHMGLPQLRHRRARRVTVSAPDLVVYADGERVAEGECVIGIRPRALTVLVPAPEGAGDD